MRKFSYNGQAISTFLMESKILKFHEILTFVGSFWLWEPLHQWPYKALCEVLQWQKVCQCTRKWQPSFHPHPGGHSFITQALFFINHNIFMNFWAIVFFSFLHVLKILNYGMKTLSKHCVEKWFFSFDEKPSFCKKK